ncbi:hypothetical protein BUALT_Bualt06G0096800 [Buddleja alternifolia]|uniref:Protein kinase domain-containing protein n=1 Tax=Buddleja alternifolia TaxID=168488 RepID=A0AAV6XFK8_9LAMI|nr:hypothetical protein BUALT_Bualt06G0096800 [Buddleja alternifolia]
MSPIAPPVMRTIGYRAPEVTDTRKSSQPSDVYSFGVVLLELLTGKSPIHTSGGEEVIHLVRWVHSVVREEWTGEVFDVELLRYPNIEEEMVAMLQIGMSCVARMPDQRPKIGEVVKMMEEIRSVNNGNTPGTRSPAMTTKNSTTDNNIVTIDLYSVYYLHPFGQPGQILVTPLLNGDNYPTWSRGVQLALEAKINQASLTAPLASPMRSPLFSLIGIVAIRWFIHDSFIQQKPQSGPPFFGQKQRIRFGLIFVYELKQNHNRSSGRSMPSQPIHHNTSQSRFPATAATIQYNSVASNPVASSVCSPTLTLEQILQLLALIQPGASDYMISDMSLFLNYTIRDPPRLVTLPNNTIIFAIHVGTVSIFFDYLISDVLFLPKFQFNLLSVNKLTSLSFSPPPTMFSRTYT